jgi:hypothetical protein
LGNQVSKKVITESKQPFAIKKGESYVKQRTGLDRD